MANVISDPVGEEDENFSVINKTDKNKKKMVQKHNKFAWYRFSVRRDEKLWFINSKRIFISPIACKNLNVAFSVDWKFVKFTDWLKLIGSGEKISRRASIQF